MRWPRVERAREGGEELGRADCAQSWRHRLAETVDLLSQAHVRVAARVRAQCPHASQACAARRHRLRNTWRQRLPARWVAGGAAQ
eukprot:633784-Prymnesium_polylepis.1